MGMNSLRAGRLTWYIAGMINRQLVEPASESGVPPAYVAWHRGFHWNVPDNFNMADVCCGRWARSPFARRVAVTEYAVVFVADQTVRNRVVILQVAVTMEDPDNFATVFQKANGGRGNDRVGGRSGCVARLPAGWTGCAARG